MLRIVSRLLTAFLVALLVAFLVGACGGEAPGPEGDSPIGTRAVSLVEHWQDVRVDRPTSSPEGPSPEGPQRSEVRFDGTGIEASWRPVAGIENLRVEDGRLVGRTTSAEPVIAVDLAAPQGTDDELWAVELRLRASAGTRAGVHPMLVPGPPPAVVQARLADWPLSTALVPGEETRTYSVELDRVFLLEMRPAERSIERLMLSPTNEAGAELAVESVRLVFREERLASIDSGPGWHGLGEVFRETLVARAPEVLRFPATLPARAWFDLSVGTIDTEPPTFRVELAVGDEVETLAVLRPDEPETWTSARVDLEPWAGREVELRLVSEGEPGQLAFWGAPTIRSSLPEDSPAGDEPGRPTTVIVFLADTLRADHLEAWGYERETAPTLARLASEGVLFSNTLAQATWTKVSVSSILTSLYPSTTGVRGLHDRISAGETTLAEVVRDAGFATFATSSVPFSGQLTNLHQGVEVMYEFGAVPDDGTRTHPTKTSEAWIDAYLEWLEIHRDVPTLAFVHVMDPHSPFRPEPPYDTLWSTPEDAERFERQGEKVTPFIESPLLRRFLAPSRADLDAAGVDAESFVAQEKAWYDGSIRAMDVEVARLFEQLEALGVRDRTLFAFVSDHGEEFLEHGHHWHGRTVYGEVANVPMALWGRGVPAGVVVDEVVQAIDLVPTVLDLVGLEIPERAQGRSLVPVFTGEGERSRPAFVEHHGEPGSADERTAFAIVDGDWKLVWYPDADEHELYRRSTDPLDQDDLAAEHPEEVERLAADLRRWREWAENQRLDEAEVTSTLDAEQLEQLRSLGYVE